MPDSVANKNFDNIVKEVQEFLLRENIDPVKVFRLYGLQYRKRFPLKQRQLHYWFDYLDAYNERHETNSRTLYEVINECYPFKTLLESVTWGRQNQFEKQLENEMSALYLKAKTTPIKFFTFLKLDKFGAMANLFTKPTFRYWLRYCTLYNSDPKVEVKILPILFKHYGKERILRSFISSDSTEDLKDEMNSAGFASYIKWKMSVKKVCAQETAANTKSVCTRNSCRCVFFSASGGGDHFEQVLGWLPQWSCWFCGLCA